MAHNSPIFSPTKFSCVQSLAISAGMNVYFPHSKVLMLKQMNVRMFVLLGLFI